MSSETFTTAMFLIAAIISAGVLINAVFPVIYTMSGTIASSSHQADQRIRTDVKIVNAYASANEQEAHIWLKNIGTSRIAESEIGRSDVFIGVPGNFERLSAGSWTYSIVDDTNNYWDPGETIHITAQSNRLPGNRGDVVYFSFVLSTGLSRSIEFSASD
ncbi:hypothetical protein ASZ90_011144 [hydrocarbon metagenome]|uniref:Uncharacterized protein n=1 Tax=hydrocarbon metagenome TaxID=938273 RepID=A0A0W8FE46_9ZZZZ